MARSLKHEMLKQMGKTGSTYLLVTRAHIIPNIGVYGGNGVIFVQDYMQTIGQVKFGAWNVKLFIKPTYS